MQLCAKQHDEGRSNAPCAQMHAWATAKHCMAYMSSQRTPLLSLYSPPFLSPTMTWISCFHLGHTSTLFQLSLISAPLCCTCPLLFL